jgi:predicted Zn-dependent protease
VQPKQYPIGRVNVKLILILVVVAAALVGLAFAARQVRREVLSKRDLADGLAAYDRKDWPGARKSFQEYLARKPKDAAIFGKFAESVRRCEPMETRDIQLIESAYREMLNLTPADAEPYRRLADLYTYVGNYSDLGYIAQRRLEQAPEDFDASLWKADSLLQRREFDSAKQVAQDLVGRLKKRSEKHLEFVEACRLLSGLCRQDASPQGLDQAAKWLDQAVDYDPASPEARLQRAAFLRACPSLPGQPKEAMLAKASLDLEQARAHRGDDPRIALALSQEYVRAGKADLAHELLQAAWNASDDAVLKRFFTTNDWRVSRFLQAAELSFLRNKPQEALPEGEALLSGIRERRYRVGLLPQVVRLCDASGNVTKARQYLDEYLNLVDVLQLKNQEDQVRMLKSIVATAEGKSGEVIELLEPRWAAGKLNAAGLGTLAAAYRRTGRQAQAVRVMTEYLQLLPKDAKMWQLLAAEHLKSQQWQAAVQAARQGHAADPASLDCRLVLIEAELYQAALGGGGPAAITALSAELADLAAKQPADSRIRLLLAKAQHALGHSDAAEKQLRQAIADCKNTLDVELQLAGLLMDQKRWKDAVDAAEQACKRHSHLGQPWMVLAEAHQSAGNLEEAQKAIQRGLAAVDAPYKPELTFRMAGLELLNGQKQQGLARLRTLANENPRDSLSRGLLLSLPEVLADPKDSERLLEEVRKAEGESSQLWRRHRLALWMRGDSWRSQSDLAVKTLTEWTRQDPTSSMPQLALARIQLRLGHAREAEDICHRAIAANPASVEVAQLLMEILASQKRLAEAAGVMDALQAPTPQLSMLRGEVALAGGGGAKQAMDDLAAQAAQDRNDAGVRLLLARLVYEKSGDIKRAFKYLDEFDALQPDSATATWLRATFLKADGRAKEAQQCLDALVKKTGSFEAYALRAQFYRATGQAPAAEADLVKLTTLQPRADGYRMLSSFYQAAGRADDALQALDRGTKAEPDNLPLGMAMVQSLIGRGGPEDRDKAMAVLDSLEKRHGQLSEIMYARASILMMQDSQVSRRQAQSLLQKVMEAEPADERAYLGLIRIAELDDLPRIAKATAAKGLEAVPNSIPMLLAQARADLALKDPAAAADSVRQVLQSMPHEPEAVDLLARIAAASRQPAEVAEALDEAHKALAAHPGDFRPALTASSLLVATGDPKQAIAELAAYVKLPQGQDNVTVLVALAGLCRQQGQTAESQKWLDRAAKIAPQNPGVIMERLDQLSAAGSYDEIVSLVAKLRQEKHLAPAVSAKAAGLLAATPSPVHRKQALEMAEESLSVKPSVPARLQVAYLAYQAADPALAQKLYEQVLAEDPQDVAALNGLAWTLADCRKDYQAALPWSDKAVELAGEDANIRHTRGVILSNLPGRTQDAKKELETCLSLARNNPAIRAEALLVLAGVCRQLNDPSSARQHLEEALRLAEGKNLLSPEQRREADLMLKQLPPAGAPPVSH